VFINSIWNLEVVIEEEEEIGKVDRGDEVLSIYLNKDIPY
jgi:hypothetical protein